VEAASAFASRQTEPIPAPAAAPRVTTPSGWLTEWLERGRRHLRRATVTWPTRVRIRGRLTDLAGEPLASTPVRMLERIGRGRWRGITGVRTRADGRLTTFTRIGPSRQVRLAYGAARVHAPSPRRRAPARRRPGAARLPVRARVWAAMSAGLRRHTARDRP
jgi:hypothetical protein